MELGLQERVALVNAGSKGLGRAVARELAREGAKVALSSRDGHHVAEAVAAIRQESGGVVEGYQADVSKAEDIRRLVRDVAQKYGQIDVLVANSGGPPSGKFVDFDDGAWESAFNLNFMSVVRSIREVLPYMKGGGRIVYIASSSVRQPLPNLILSNTMRSAVVALMKTLADELAERGILINTVAPGRIATERVEHLDRINGELRGLSMAEVREEWQRQIPLGRYGEAEEFAKAVVFLSSWANTYITGQLLLVDGGLVRSM